MSTATKTKWTMPEWMEPYREYIGSTAGNTVEDLISRLDDPHISKTNFPVFVLAVGVASQVDLLLGLHRNGKLRP